MIHQSFLKNLPRIKLIAQYHLNSVYRETTNKSNTKIVFLYRNGISSAAHVPESKLRKLIAMSFILCSNGVKKSGSGSSIITIITRRANRISTYRTIKFHQLIPHLSMYFNTFSSGLRLYLLSFIKGRPIIVVERLS